MIVEIKNIFSTVGFKFDAQSVFFLCQQWDVDLNNLDNVPQDEYMDSWVWCAHRSYCLPRYKRPMSYQKMRKYISSMHKSEWDKILQAMMESRSGAKGDKKKALIGESSLSQDGKQE